MFCPYGAVKHEVYAGEPLIWWDVGVWYATELSVG